MAVTELLDDVPTTGAVLTAGREATRETEGLTGDGVETGDGPQAEPFFNSPRPPRRREGPAVEVDDDGLSVPVADVMNLESTGSGRRVSSRLVSWTLCGAVSAQVLA